MRKAKFPSQEAFAIKVGLSERGYQKYEQGESSPTPDILDRFARVLGCTAVDLISREATKDRKTVREAELTFSSARDVLDAFEKAPPDAREQALALLLASADPEFRDQVLDRFFGAQERANTKGS